MITLLASLFSFVSPEIYAPAESISPTTLFGLAGILAAEPALREDLESLRSRCAWVSSDPRQSAPPPFGGRVDRVPGVADPVLTAWTLCHRKDGTGVESHAWAFRVVGKKLHRIVIEGLDGAPVGRLFATHKGLFSARTEGPDREGGCTFNRLAIGPDDRARPGRAWKGPATSTAASTVCTPIGQVVR